MKCLLLFSATLATTWAACAVPNPQVTTANGKVEGLCVNDDVNGFYSIPFAEPPVRFEKPVAKSNWTGVLSTKVMPPRCTQVTGDPNSEDCLYLNVFAPAAGSGGRRGPGHHGHGHGKPGKPKLRLPVLTIVYGGAFATGGARNQGTPEHIAKNLVAKGVVVVVIQYRVGPLGFCTTGDSVMKGNYGMWDATMALQWIHDNIAAFGGNPDDVTCYGGSAGAGMIEGMHLSPYSTHLFHKMIIWSGAAQDQWEAKTKLHCEERATSLGLTWTDSASFKAALFGADANGLKGGWQLIGESAFESLLCDWAPNYDGDFFPSTGKAMRDAILKPKPTMNGVAYLEGAGMSGYFNMSHSTVERIVDYMVPASTPNRSDFRAYFLEQYRDQAAILEPAAQDKHAAQAAFGERTVAAAVDATTRRYLERFGANQTMYRYVFKHFNPAQIGASFPFISYASHSFDQYYGLGLAGFTFVGADAAVVDIYTNALTNFVKTGNPNGSGATALPVEWKPATAEHPSLNYIIESTPAMSPHFFHGRPHLNNILNKQAGLFKEV